MERAWSQLAAGLPARETDGGFSKRRSTYLPPPLGPGNLLGSSAKVQGAAELVGEALRTVHKGIPADRQRNSHLQLHAGKPPLPPPFPDPPFSPSVLLSFSSPSSCPLHTVQGVKFGNRSSSCQAGGKHAALCSCNVNILSLSLTHTPSPSLSLYPPFPTFPSTFPIPSLTSLEGHGSQAAGKAPLSNRGASITSPVYLNNLAWGPPWPGCLQPHPGQDLRRHWLKARSGGDRLSSPGSRLQLLPPLQDNLAAQKILSAELLSKNGPKCCPGTGQPGRGAAGLGLAGSARPAPSLSAAAASPPPERGSQLVTVLWNWGPI